MKHTKMSKTEKSIFNLKKLSILAFIALICGGTAFAQPGGQQGPPPGIPGNKQIKKMVKDLDKALDLNDKQEDQISDLYFAHFKKIESIQKSKQRPTPEAMEKLDKQLETSIRESLNDDQQKKYTSFLKKQKKQGPQQPRGQAPPGGQSPQGGHMSLL